MSTIVAVATSGKELDRITVNDDGSFAYATGVAAELVDGLLRTGMTPESVAGALANWSNGYVLTRRLPDDAPELPPIPGFAALLD